MAILQAGDKAPEFELQDQHGEKVNSKDIEGKILLSFHPLAFTSVCTDQMRDLSIHLEEFEKKGVTPLGVSVDSQPAKAVWAQAIGLDSKILADFNPKGDLAKKCGVYDEENGFSKRSVLLMEDGKVLWSKEYPMAERPDIEEILDHC